MPDSLWNRTWTLFHAAMELNPEEREAFLDRECGADEALRREVGELIANAAPSGVLDRSPADAVAPLPASEQLEGKRIGHYVIRTRIGYGGMGVVYDAEQESPVRRQVALKVIHPGTHPDAAARFTVERQALALMNHPHIARVFDAGVMDDGRPFIAMEYVAGLPINDYCDRHSLGVSQRLELFILVCNAIQHAHQKGIIHRDIKPSNVLVTVVDGVPLPKVIDFGVAKALQPLPEAGDARTSHGVLIGTIEYMSPEQLDPAGSDIDTRSDIYSLGAMLYELLAGILPFDWPEIRKAGLEGLRKVARESEPPRASRRFRELDPERAAVVAAKRRTSSAALPRQLEGDLDWILLKALDRDRTRRYASASELADDIRRHLAHEPVVAGPPSANYRLRKFVRRHRAAVAIVGAIVITLAAVAAMLTKQSMEIRRSAARAESQRVRAERVSEVMVDIFRASDPFQGMGADVTARQVLDRSSKRIAEDKTLEPQVKASVLSAIGRAYLQLRVYDDAEKFTRQALAMRREIHDGDHLEIADSLESLGVVLLDRANVPAADRAIGQAVAMKSRLLSADDPRRAEGLYRLGGIRRNQGQYDEADAYLNEALRIAGNENLEANIRGERGNVAVRRGDLEEAERRYRDELVLRRRIGNEPKAAESIARIGSVQYERGDYTGAETTMREGISLLEKHLPPDHERFAAPFTNLGLALHFQSRYEEAEEYYLRALAIWRKRQGDSHPGVTSTLNNLGLLFHDQSDFAQADRYFRESLELQRKYSKKELPEITIPINNIARLLHDQGKVVEAEKWYRQALEMRKRLLKPDHPQIAESLGWLGKLLTEKGSVAEAEPMLREAVAIREKAIRAGDWRIAEMRSLLGGNLVAQKRYAEAEPLLVDGYAIMEKQRGKEYRRTLQARDRVVALYEAWRKPEEAARWR